MEYMLSFLYVDRYRTHNSCLRFTGIAVINIDKAESGKKSTFAHSRPTQHVHKRV